MSSRSNRNNDRYALPTIRGQARELEPAFNPSSSRGMLRWRERITESVRPLCVSLWSGAGGLDLGLESAGYDVAVAVDQDQWACQTHAHNSHALVFCRDLGDPVDTRRFLAQLELPRIALVAAGFPCQPYSRAGRSMIRHLVRNQRREAEDERAFAWMSFVGAVAELRPERALVENVPDLAAFSDGELLRDIMLSLEELGYEVDVRVLSARRFGVPQYRERLFIQAALEGQPIAWPRPAADTVHDTLRSAIADLPPIAAGHAEDPTPYDPSRSHLAPPWARTEVDGMHEHFVFDHVCRDVREDDLEAFEGLRPGGTYLDIPEDLRRYDDKNFTDKYKRLEWERPSRTLTAHIARDGYWYIHPDQHRTLSVREAARLQTFPDSFMFAGFPSHRFTQIGNAVPPQLGRAVGQAMLEPEASHVEVSQVPDAARRLQETAAEWWQPLSPWEVLVGEAIFSGRAGPERVATLLGRLPDLESAAEARGPLQGHDAAARRLARSIIKRHDGEIPRSVEDLARLRGLTTVSGRLVATLLAGSGAPLSSATLRVAMRVGGVERAGSLTGVLHVVLARLARFGEDVAANQLLLDLARNVCTAEEPSCNVCPLAESCAYAARYVAEPSAAASYPASSNGRSRRTTAAESARTSKSHTRATVQPAS
jgi:DNA (cytosine-5)-methyltransferase 1